MKLRIGLACAVVFLLSACATAPQTPIALSKESLAAGQGRIGVVMTSLPKVDTSLPGADCLLCMAVASAANSALTDHTRTLSYEDLPQLKQSVADAIRKKGMNVTLIPENIDLKLLPDAKNKGPGIATKDFSSLAQKYQIDRLLVIDISALGVVRNYSAYVPTSDPKGMLKGTGYIVNLKDNTYQWYMPVDVAKSAEGNWDEPPKFPGVTNAYYQALEIGKDTFLKPFAN